MPAKEINFREDAWSEGQELRKDSHQVPRFHFDRERCAVLVHCSNSLPLRLLFNSFTKILHGQKEVFCL